jgi:anaphase-promoting complex subunit 5
MTRYLTPWRVSLLCLVTLYTDGVVPNSSAIHVLSFLTAGLFPLDPADKQWQEHYLPSIAELEVCLAGHESSVPGRSLWDLFLKNLWSLDSMDALETFFSDVIPSMLAKSRDEQIQDRDNGIAPEPEDRMRLSRSSPLGAFVRRSYLEYTRLQFHDSVKLWTGFVKYRLPTYTYWSRRHRGAEGKTVDANLRALGLDSTSHLSQVVYGNIEYDEEDEGVVSIKDAERLVEFQVGELQSTCSSSVSWSCANRYRDGRQGSRRNESSIETHHNLGVNNAGVDVLPRVRSDARRHLPGG